MDTEINDNVESQQQVYIDATLNDLPSEELPLKDIEGSEGLDEFFVRQQLKIFLVQRRSSLVDATCLAHRSMRLSSDIELLREQESESSKEEEDGLRDENMIRLMSTSLRRSIYVLGMRNNELVRFSHSYAGAEVCPLYLVKVGESTFSHLTVLNDSEEENDTIDWKGDKYLVAELIRPSGVEVVGTGTLRLELENDHARLQLQKGVTFTTVRRSLIKDWLVVKNFVQKQEKERIHNRLNDSPREALPTAKELKDNTKKYVLDLMIRKKIVLAQEMRPSVNPIIKTRLSNATQELLQISARLYKPKVSHLLMKNNQDPIFYRSP